MKLVSVKKESQIVLNGINFDVLWTDGSIAQVTATDLEGNLVCFKKESYDFRVLVKEPPKQVVKFLLKGTVAECPVHAMYDERYQAQQAMDTHQNMVSRDEYCSLEIEEVTVAETDA